MLIYGVVSYIYFAFFHLSTWVFDFNMSPKILNQSTSYLVEAFPLTQGGDHLSLKNLPGVRVGMESPKFGPNDKR